jgi:gliding motility-associated protein GldM
MINMMYLVLTALLALNVSKEILDSFVTVNNGLETTKGTLQEKMNSTYETFQGLAQENDKKYGAAWREAEKMKNEASAIISYIDNLKALTISETEKIPMEQVIAKGPNGVDTVLSLQHVSKKDDYDSNTNLLIGPEPANPKEGENTAVELRQKLEAFRDRIKAVAGDKNPTIAANADRMFNFEDRPDAYGKNQKWENMNFYHVPLAATTTIMSKIQGDVRNMENEVVNWMMGEVEGQSFKFNKLAAIVKPQSSYVTVGAKYQAEIFLGAYDDQNAPEVYICGPGATLDTLKKEIIGEAIKLDNIGARAQLEVPATGAGVKTVSGIIKFKPVGGEETVELFSTSYEVAAPNLVVSPTKMNVFYRGVDNPVDVSVSGYSDKDLSVSMSNGSLSKGANGYIVKPGKGKIANINVTASNPDGSKKSYKSIDFRCKNVPNPEPYFAGKSIADGTVKKAEVTAAQGVIAKMVDFEFDLKFQVVGFKLVTIVGGTPIEKFSKSAYLTEDMKTILQKSKPGQKIYIEAVKAKGPDGTVRNLGNIALKVT